MSAKDRKFWTEFLKLYQSMPCLWRVKSEDYYNRVLKASSYNKLIKKLREFDKDATRETVVRKINNFRTNYRRDLRKSMKNELSGTETEPPFRSTLWYFDLLKFLEDQENTNESSSTMDIKYESQNSMNDYGSETSLASVGPAPSSPWQSPSPSLSPSPSPITLTLPTPLPPSKKKKLNNNVELQSLEFVSETPIKDDNDAIDILGKGWASQYAELSKSQKIYARTIFADILYHGCLNHLSEQKVEDIHHVLQDTLTKRKTRGEFSRFENA